MAVTKIKPVKSTLSKALDYIENPDKTDEKMLISSFGCSVPGKSAPAKPHIARLFLPLLRNMRA